MNTYHILYVTRSFLLGIIRIFFRYLSHYHNVHNNSREPAFCYDTAYLIAVCTLSGFSVCCEMFLMTIDDYNPALFQRRNVV